MRTFLAVVEHHSIRDAAAALHVTESAVSAAISHMEKSLSAELFVRDGRGIRLTESGRIYAGYCRTIVAMVEQASEAVRSAGHGRLRIGAVATASESVLPTLLASFRDRHPEIELTLTVLPRDDLFDAQTHHETDLVIAGRPPPDSNLTTRAMRANRLIVVGAPDSFDHALAATWLLRGPGSGTRDTALGLLAQLDAAPPTLTLGTHGAVVAAAREGLGVTLVHADAVEDDLSRGLLATFPLRHTPLDRPWHVVTTDLLTGSASLFLAHITDSALVGSSAFHLLKPPVG
ncbi:MAG: LysR family transcriptional regulator [Flavobacterium sp.]|nr:LysR family transcriptional regulator [Aeromicrobium sp.]